MTLLSKLRPNASSLKQEEQALFYLLTLSEYLPRSRSKSVPFLPQKYNWDCGLACVLMVLRAIEDNEWDLESLMKLCPIKSVWTIDLAFLLKKLNHQFAFLTVQMGTDPDFASCPYYARSYSEDQVRVDGLFKEALSQQVTIIQHSLHLSELKALSLMNTCFVILLLNKRKIDYLTWTLYCMNIDLGIGDQFGYQGHYILLVGYDEDKRSFLVNDPAKKEQSWIPEFAVEEARRSYGTDEDTLIVFLTSS